MSHWHAYLFAFFCMALAIGLDMLYPIITRSIVDDVIVGGRMELLGGLLLGIFSVGAGRCLGVYGKEYTFDIVSSKIGSRLRKDLFSHIQDLSMDYFDNANTGELMARLKDDVDYIWGAVGYVGMLLVEVVAHVSIVLFCMYRISWKLALAPTAVVVATGALAIVMERKLDRIAEEISEENAALTAVAEENLAGVRTVKAFAREGFEITKFRAHNRRYYELHMKQSRALMRYYPMFQFVARLLPVAMVILGGGLVVRGELTLGSLVAFSEYCRNIVWPMEMLGWLSKDVSTAVASYKKIDRIYQETPSIREPEHPVALREALGEVCFSHVDFGRDGQQILSDVSFRIPPGRTLGVMGATGAGKTSIVNLLQRFYDADGGEVRLDGENVRHLSLRQLRGSIAVVMQDVFLFSDTIEENIKMGSRRAIGHDAMARAADMACAKGFIEKMKMQYGTVIGERGVGLSGGQKQRISIARAIARRTPVLVLDDAGSALDMETEAQVQAAIRELAGVTKIIISHRISAVRSADEIIFLKNGAVAERGTHGELMGQRGLYYETYRAQYGESEGMAWQ